MSDFTITCIVAIPALVILALLATIKDIKRIKYETFAKIKLAGGFENEDDKNNKRKNS